MLLRAILGPAFAEASASAKATADQPAGRPALLAKDSAGGYRLFAKPSGEAPAAFAEDSASAKATADRPVGGGRETRRWAHCEHETLYHGR